MIVDMIFILSWVIGLKRLVADRLNGSLHKSFAFL